MFWDKPKPEFGWKKEVVVGGQLELKLRSGDVDVEVELVQGLLELRDAAAAAAAAAAAFSCSLRCLDSMCLHFILRFWNQTLTLKMKKGHS